MGDVSFDPLAPEMAVDPYPHYHRLRELDPVHRSALGFWFLTRHADVDAFFSNRALQHRYVQTQRIRLGAEVEKEPYFDHFRRMVFVLDDPDHRRIRHLFASTFTARRVTNLRPRVEAIANELLDELGARREMDLIAEFAMPFPVRVISELLGIPKEDVPTVHRWVEALSPALEFLPMSPETLARANEAMKTSVDYFRELAGRRRQDPQEDLFSAMVAAASEEETLDEDEIVANAILLYLAGFETTAGGTGLAILALHRNPDQLEILRDDPGLMPDAVRELLRYDAPGQATARVATEPVDFGDTRIEAGEAIVAWIGSGNRDPEVFPDPDRLDVRRPVGQRLLTFGGGAHHCLGYALAAQELEVALETLLRRCPHLELETLDPPFRETSLMRGVRSLRATW